MKISLKYFILYLCVLQNDHDDYPKHSEPELFYVHSDFIDDVGDCVSLQRGDIVEKQPSGWWFGRRLKNDFILTWIPSAFLQKIQTI